MSEKQVFTLKQVVSSIRKTIEERYKQLYWVKAEMHKLNQFPSGHCFPELVQKEDGKVVAEMRGTIWKHQFEKINQRFIQVVKEPLKEDTTLLLQVRVAFHETYGLSLQILDIDPNYALGELQKEREATIKRLKLEGLLNRNQQQDFPLLPQRIAIISADASKGLSDFYNVIKNNDWNYSFFTMLFPAYLQGDVAASSICEQLDRIRKVKRHFDVVVIVRGGGGEVGLSCYNNYDLCKAIAEFPLPVLTGIGHSTNLTVAEMISYRNAITPTELGEFLIQAFHNFSVPVKDAIKSIRNQTEHLLKIEKMKLGQLSESFQNRTINRLQKTNSELKNNGFKLQKGVQFTLSQKKEQVSQSVYQLQTNSFRLLEDQDGEISVFLKDIRNASKARFSTLWNGLDNISQLIRLTDPINVLKRGYSLTTLDGKAISNEHRVKKGDMILTKTATFEIESTVTKTKDNE